MKLDTATLPNDPEELKSFLLDQEERYRSRPGSNTWRRRFAFSPRLSSAKRVKNVLFPTKMGPRQDPGDSKHSSQVCLQGMRGSGR